MKVRLLGLIVAFAVNITTVPLATEAQQARTVPRIALVVNTPEADVIGPVPRGRGARAFLEGLLDLGWVDGQNIQVERRSTEGRSDRAQLLLQEMVRLQVDAIVAVGSATVRAAKQATGTIPIVMAGKIQRFKLRS
jgi:putative ABC transport system substrate-binding protein